MATAYCFHLCLASLFGEDRERLSAADFLHRDCRRLLSERNADARRAHTNHGKSGRDRFANLFLLFRNARFVVENFSANAEADSARCWCHLLSPPFWVSNVVLCGGLFATIHWRRLLRWVLLPRISRVVELLQFAILEEVLLHLVLGHGFGAHDLSGV